MTRHSVNNNTGMGRVIIIVLSLFKFRSFDQFNPPKLPQILDIYSVVALWRLLLSSIVHMKNPEWHR